MKNINILEYKLQKINQSLQVLIKRYQADRVSILTQNDLFLKDITEIKDNIHNKKNQLSTLSKEEEDKYLLKDDFISIYLSKEFQDLKENSINGIKNELEIKFKEELLTYKNENKLLKSILIIAIPICLIISILALLK